MTARHTPDPPERPDQHHVATHAHAPQIPGRDHPRSSSRGHPEDRNDTPRGMPRPGSPATDDVTRRATMSRSTPPPRCGTGMNALPPSTLAPDTTSAVSHRHRHEHHAPPRSADTTPRRPCPTSSDAQHTTVDPPRQIIDDVAHPVRRVTPTTHWPTYQLPHDTSPVSPTDRHPDEYDHATSRNCSPITCDNAPPPMHVCIPMGPTPSSPTMATRAALLDAANRTRPVTLTTPHP